MELYLQKFKTLQDRHIRLTDHAIEHMLMTNERKIAKTLLEARSEINKILKSKASVIMKNIVPDHYLCVCKKGILPNKYYTVVFIDEIRPNKQIIVKTWRPSYPNEKTLWKDNIKKLNQ